MKTLTLMLILCGLTGLSCDKEEPAPATQPASDDSINSYPQLRPNALASHVMTYHDALGMVVMFGGSGPDRSYTNTLWGWDGQAWHVLSEEGPAPRIHAGMAYDSNRNRLVVYGGIKNREESFSDIWEWDGERWEEKKPSEADAGPGKRDHHAMAYMHSKGQVILFGGQSEDNQFLNDTWSWDGAQWQQVATSGPPPRGTHRLSYDSQRQQIMMFGGWGETQFADTWSWDGDQWSEREIEGPIARGATRSAYDQQANQLILFGGLTDREVNDETWRLIDNQWELVQVEGPDARNVHAMAYHKGLKSIFLYGGITPAGRMDDLWRWDGSAWMEID